MLYAIAMGHYYKIIGHVTHTAVHTCSMHLRLYSVACICVYCVCFLFSGWIDQTWWYDTTHYDTELVKFIQLSCQNAARYTVMNGINAQWFD